jgi:hypothetical protein
VSKRKVLRVEGKVKVKREINNGKRKAEVRREIGVVVRRKWLKKTEHKLLVRVNRMDRE